jgi:hypothetical protein
MKPFLSGRAQVPCSTLQPVVGITALPPGSPQPSAPADAGDHGGPVVECVRQGDKVVRIVVTCACGERIEIDCHYPPGA